MFTVFEFCCNYEHLFIHDETVFALRTVVACMGGNLQKLFCHIVMSLNVGTYIMCSPSHDVPEQSWLNLHPL